MATIRTRTPVRRDWWLSALLVAVVVASAALAWSVPRWSGRAAPRAAAPAAAADSTFVLACDGSALRLPLSFVLYCADAGGSLTNLAWTSWGGTEAAAAGTLALNDCEPDCASGEILRYPVSVTAAQRHERDGLFVYGELRVRFLADGPDWLDDDGDGVEVYPLSSTPTDAPRTDTA